MDGFWLRIQRLQTDHRRGLEQSIPGKTLAHLCENGFHQLLYGQSYHSKREKVEVYEWNSHMSIIGEDKEKTIITYDDYFDKINLGRNSTFHTPTFLVQGNDFYAVNLTIENTAGEVGQAVALAVNADRVLIENCRITGNQDTLYTTGEGFKQYYKDSYIEGTTDFIFGQATALFQNCIIHSKSESFITAASTPKGSDFGYVFNDCKLTADEGLNKVYLGRPWRTYAKTVFINCYMGNHIIPKGRRSRCTNGIRTCLSLARIRKKQSLPTMIISIK